MRKSMAERERQFNVMVGARIAAARKERGVKAVQLMQAAGVSKNQLRAWEKGICRCPPMVLDIFAQRLDVSLRSLVPRMRSGAAEAREAGAVQVI